MQATYDEMKQWAETEKGGIYKRYIHNKDVLRMCYMKYNKPKFIQDVVVDEDTDLLLTILEVNERDITICESCYKQQCKCGSEMYVDKITRKAKAIDASGDISLSLPPWKEDIELVEEQTYRVTGKVTEYNERKEVRVATAVLATEDDMAEYAEGAKQITQTQDENRKLDDENPADEVEDITETLKSMLDTYNGDIPEDRYATVTKNMKDDYLGIAENKLGLYSEGGYWRQK